MIFELVDHYKIEKSARSVIFVGRQRDGREKHYFHVDNFYPYFGVPWDERYKVADEYSLVDIEESHDIYGNKIAKIIVKRADNVAYLRDRFLQTYEDNILFHDRVKIDLNIRSGFEIDDKHIVSTCWGCKPRTAIKYHDISHKFIRGI